MASGPSGTAPKADIESIRSCRPAAAVAAFARRGLDRLARARRAGVPREARPAMLAVWRAEPVLRRASAEPGLVAEARLEGSEFARRGGLLLRAATGRW